MTAQPIKGFGSEAIPACYVLGNQRLGKQCYKRTCKHPEREEEEGRDFSGSLV